MSYAMNRRNLWCASALAAIIAICLIRDMVPSGRYTARPDLSRITPQERVTLDSGAAIFSGDPAYLDLRLPRRFETMEARVDYDTTGPYPCAAGVATGTPEAPGYDLRTYAHPGLPGPRPYIVTGAGTVYTNAPLFKLTAYGAEGLQTVLVGDREVQITDPLTPYWVTASEPVTRITLSSRGVQLAGPGSFAASPEGLTPPADEDPAADAPIDLRGAAYRGNSIRVVFSQPYVEVQPSCAIRSVELTFRRPSLRASGLIRFIREYLRDTYYALHD